MFVTETTPNPDVDRGRQLADEISRLSAHIHAANYRLLVMLAELNLRPEDVLNELARREGLSGLEEKASRSQK